MRTSPLARCPVDDVPLVLVVSDAALFHGGRARVAGRRVGLGLGAVPAVRPAGRRGNLRAGIVLFVLFGLLVLFVASSGPRVLYPEYAHAPGRPYYCEGALLGFTEARWVTRADAQSLTKSRMWRCGGPYTLPLVAKLVRRIEDVVN